MSLSLLIDDQRNLGANIIARTVEAGFIILRRLKIERLYLDHDLGERKTGLDVLRMAKNNCCLPPNIQLVTMNPVGRNNMADFLLSIGYRQNGTWFTI